MQAGLAESAKGGGLKILSPAVQGFESLTPHHLKKGRRMYGAGSARRASPVFSRPQAEIPMRESQDATSSSIPPSAWLLVHQNPFATAAPLSLRMDS